MALSDQSTLDGSCMVILPVSPLLMECETCDSNITYDFWLLDVIKNYLVQLDSNCKPSRRLPFQGLDLVLTYKIYTKQKKETFSFYWVITYIRPSMFSHNFTENDA